MNLIPCRSAFLRRLEPALAGTLTPNRGAQSYWCGALLAAYGLAQFLGAPLLGALSDRLGRRPVLLVAIFGLGLNFLVTGLSPFLWLFLGSISSFAEQRAQVSFFGLANTASGRNSKLRVEKDRPQTPPPLNRDMRVPPLAVWVGLTILLGTLLLLLLLLVILICRQQRRRVYLNPVGSLLTGAEARFHKVLRRAVPEGCVLLAKVRIADIIQVSSRHPPSRHRVFRSISSKHVDFLLADALTFEPLAAIELDDSSHARRDRRKRDELVKRIFAAADLPLIRIPTAARYSAGELAAALEEQVDRRPVTRRERS